jgi:hypothetical protein
MYLIITITIRSLLHLLPIYDSFHEIINSVFYLGVILSPFFNQVTDEENYKTLMQDIATADIANNSANTSGEEW